MTRQHENGGVALIEELESTLRDAFRSLSRHLHPDKQSGRAGSDATADFQLLKVSLSLSRSLARSLSHTLTRTLSLKLAKETLEDSKARAQYLKKLGAFRRNVVRVPWSFSSAINKQRQK